MPFRFVLKPVPDIEHHQRARRHKQRLEAVRAKKTRWMLFRGYVTNGRPETDDVDLDIPGYHDQPLMLADKVLGVPGTDIATALNHSQLLDFDYSPLDGDLFFLQTGHRSPLQLMFWDHTWKLLGPFGYRPYSAAAASVLHEGDFIID